MAGTPPPPERPFEPEPFEPEPGKDGPRIGGRRIPGGRTGLIAAATAATVILGGAGALVVTNLGDDGGGENAKVAPARVASSMAADAAQHPSEEERRKMMADRASRAARRDAAKPPVMAVRGTPPPKKTAKPDEDSEAAAPAGNPVPAGEAQRIAKAMMPKFGFNPSTQFGCLVKLWDRESSWNVHAGSPGGPYGIPQANPGTKMASAGADWRNSASTQIEWGLGYIKGRYSNPCGGWSHFQSAGWY